ncbi:MAG: recombination protein RecR [Proteobacteria bacterium]|nr:recombination protein RecR [Pseudomonadota bacterium]
MNIINELKEAFKILPGVGNRTAQRFTFYTIKANKEKIERLSDLLKEVKEKIHPCKICGNPTTEEICPICNNDTRDHSTVLIVENTEDLYQIEATGKFRGVYHILGGHLAPLENITPENLRIKELIDRIENNDIEEIILALNPNTAGEVTSIYLFDLLKKYKDIKITKPSIGLPYGSTIHYLDNYTIMQGISDRKEFKEQ